MKKQEYGVSVGEYVLEIKKQEYGVSVSCRNIKKQDYK